MKVITYKHVFHDSSKDNEFVLIAMGDFHIGAKSVDYCALRADVEVIANNPHWRVILMGDLINAQNRKHQHYNESEHIDWLYGKTDVLLEEQIYLGKLLQPIAEQNQIIAYVAGNHEDNQKNHADNDTYHRCARELTLPYKRNAGDIMLGYTGFVHIQFTHQMKTGTRGVNSSLNIFAHHGHGGGSAHSSVVNKLAKLMEAYDADIYLQGHHHKRATHKTNVLGVSQTGRMVIRKKLAFGVASYMDTYAESNNDGTPNITYAERKAYMITNIGATVITHRPKRGGIPALTTSVDGDYTRLSEILHKI